MNTIAIVDAFVTDRAFSGNPAAVCLLGKDTSDAWLQGLAQEMNLSETAYPRRRADGDWDLRWFTPTTEVDLCGHATLASAHRLWERGLVEPAASIRFHSRSGPLGVRQGDNGLLELDFPMVAYQPADLPAGEQETLLEALGVMPLAIARAGPDLLVELPEPDVLIALQPDFPTLARLPYRGIIVTSPGDQADIDCISRFFAPAAGVAEDPVTGSAHCALAPYWGRRLARPTLTAAQRSHRGGLLHLRLDGQRVRIAGRARTVASGDLLLEPAAP